MPPCPCGTGQPFEHCCAPYLNGSAHAPTAEALMRSRYTAYTLRDSAYLARTWDAATRPAALTLENDLEWLGLTILATQEGRADDSSGVVEFVARYRLGNTQGELHEASRFRKVEGAWYYLDGRATERPARHGEDKVGRNDPCPCGSGKKFKKCCGR